MSHLTNTVVETAAAPKAGQTFIRDDEIEGFALRVIATDDRSFVFEGRIKRRMRRITVGRYPDMTVGVARQKALEIRVAIGRGDDPAEARIFQKYESTFGELAERSLHDYALLYKKPRSVADDKYYLAHYIPSGWETRQLSDITRTDIEQLHFRVARDHGNTQRKPCRAAICAICSISRSIGSFCGMIMPQLESSCSEHGANVTWRPRNWLRSMKL
jgi:hypothetical protein